MDHSILEQGPDLSLHAAGAPEIAHFRAITGLCQLAWFKSTKTKDSDVGL